LSGFFEECRLAVNPILHQGTVDLLSRETDVTDRIQVAEPLTTVLT
jgi:hypothetical protein